MPTVIIDGVEYIPAKECVANYLSVAKGLLVEFWGVCSDAKAEELINDPSIRVLVNDYGQGVPLSSVISSIAKQA